MSRLQGRAGFSLVELLISIIIISIGIVGFATAVGLMATELWFGLARSAMAGDDTEPSMLVADQVSELKATGAGNVTPGSRVEGDYQIDWTIETTQPTRMKVVVTYNGHDGNQRADTIIAHIPD